MTRRFAALAAGLSLLALAACSEEETIVAQVEPAAPQETVPPADDDTDDAVDKLREGAGSLLEGAGELAGEARERAEKALEDAGPALDRAGEIARDIGSSLDEIARQALTDFDKGIELLEKRIAEATGEPETFTGNPDAVLAPADQLNADTRAAARAGTAGLGPDYVGVWAGDAVSCQQIDQQPVELFAVITPTTIRRYESVCNVEPMTSEGGTATLAASCVAEGDMEERQIVLEMPDDNTLEIGTTDAPASATLTRCRLPE
jgi:hypothetical protein